MAMRSLLDPTLDSKSKHCAATLEPDPHGLKPLQTRTLKTSLLAHKYSDPESSVANFSIITTFFRCIRLRSSFSLPQPLRLTELLAHPFFLLQLRLPLR
jgi:hypothetical protein